MASGRAADREDPNNSKRQAARSLDRDPTSELHQGQRSDAPHRRAGQMTAPDHFAETLLNILRRRGPSTYGIMQRRCPIGAALKNGEVLRLFGDLRDRLDGCRPRADDADALAAEIHRRVRPPCRVISRALEAPGPEWPG